MSQTLTTSTNGDLVSTGRYWPDTLPQPITPVRIRLGGASAANTPTPEATAVPARRVVLANSRRLSSWSVVFICLLASYCKLWSDVKPIGFAIAPFGLSSLLCAHYENSFSTDHFIG